MEARLDLAKAKGCDGVDPDNVDGYANATGFPLTYADQKAYDSFLATQAHARGLAVGLKNDLDQIPDLLPQFDFAVNESCFDYDECGALTPFVKSGKAVFGILYDGAPATLCPQANALGLDTIFKHQALDAYRVSCR